MGVEKTFGDVVRVFVVVDMFMMPAMIAHPHQDRILERGGAEDEREQAHRQFRPESCVRKQTMITKRYAEASRGRQHSEQGEVEPINTEIPQVKWQRGECENKRAYQERTCRPIDAVDWNTENQGRENLGRITGSLIAAENDVLLCPGMNAAAMRAGDLLCF